jgi:hypothetical protein
MKNSSEFIAKQVFLTNVFYINKQNKTKELFFRCLREKRSNSYFQNELHKIWGNVNHKFMDNQIEKLMMMVHSNNVDEAINIGRLEGIYKETEDWVMEDEYFKLTPEEYFQKFERKFEQNVNRVYKRSKDSIRDLDSETYLQKTLDRYDKNINQVVTYFNKSGQALRQVQLATYLSMIHNTNLTRAGWNQTMSDSERVGNDYFIIPYHPFSCLHCFEYQNRPLSKYEVESIIGVEAREQVGDILHPNCKCTLSIYWDNSQVRNRVYNTDEVETMYDLRQKVNSLTLEKSKLRTDMKIAKEVGNEALADKNRQRINAINKTIRGIKTELPTNSLKKQITAIKR